MTIRAFNSVGGYSVGSDNPQNIILANGDITTVNFTANGVSNLGPIGNVFITGGTTGQAIITDGSGNLSFGTVASNSAAPMPYYIPSDKSYIVPTNFQGLFAQPITIDGTFEVDGELIDVSRWIASPDNEVLFSQNNFPVGSSSFTFDPTSGNLGLSGNINITGNIIPSTSNTYSLGTSSDRWTNIWLSGNTIYLGNSVITEIGGNLILQNPTGAQVVVTGTSSSSDLTLTGNLTAGNVRTDNYQYANGMPIDFIHAAGSDNQIQFNTGGNLGASANLTFDSNTNLLTLTGNIATSNANLGDTAQANYLVSTLGCVTIGGGMIGVIGTQAGIFSSYITDINIGLYSNVTIGSTTGNVTVRNNLNANGTITANSVSSDTIEAGDFYSKRPSINVTTNTLIDSFSITEYRSAKYTIKVSDNTGYQALEVLLIHNDINSIITIYGSISMTGLDLITLNSIVIGSDVELRATGLNSNTSVNLMGTYVPD
jgi:hypothetical protein